MKYLISLISLGVLLSGCSLMPEKKIENPSGTQSGAVAESFDYGKELNSISSKIKSTEEFNKCLSQNINMCSQSVGMELAQKQKSAEFCRELK